MSALLLTGSLGSRSPSECDNLGVRSHDWVNTCAGTVNPWPEPTSLRFWCSATAPDHQLVDIAVPVECTWSVLYSPRGLRGGGGLGGVAGMVARTHRDHRKGSTNPS
eukprot:231908-Rhodomonas_salina.2